MITNTITFWREAKGVSKAHMARYVGVERSYMTKLEQGRLQPSGEMMFRMAKYLNQPLEVLFQHSLTPLSPVCLRPRRANEQVNGGEPTKGREYGSQTGSIQNGA